MHTIVSEGDTAGPGVTLVVVAIVCGLIGLVLTVAGRGADVTSMWVTGVVLVLVGVALIVLAARSLSKVRRMDPGVLQVESPLHLSSTVPAQFRRRIKRGSREVRSLNARMVLREWVRYTVGTDTRTATQDVLTRPLSIQPIPDPDGVAGVLQLELPNFPPSFVGRNSQLRWYVVVDLELADGFTEDSLIPLQVPPVVRGGGG